MIRVFGLILTEYLDRFQPSIWTDSDRVFGFWIFQLMRLWQIRSLRRSSISWYSAGRQCPLSLVSFISGKSSCCCQYLKHPGLSGLMRARLVSASSFSPFQRLSLLRVIALCRKFLSDCVGNLPYFIGQIWEYGVGSACQTFCTALILQIFFARRWSIFRLWSFFGSLHWLHLAIW